MKLERGFWNYSGNRGYWSYAQVIHDKGIVCLRGLIVRGNFLPNNYKFKETLKENKYSAGRRGNRQWRNSGNRYSNKAACAIQAKNNGMKYFKIQDNNCKSAYVYNSSKPKEEFQKICLSIPEHRCGTKLLF